MFQGQGGGGQGSNDPFARMNRMMHSMFNGNGSFFSPTPFARSPFFTDPFFSLPSPNVIPSLLILLRLLKKACGRDKKKYVHVWMPHGMQLCQPKSPTLEECLAFSLLMI